MTEGFILSNKYRKVVFAAFTAGETSIDRIAKKHRIIPSIVQRIIQEFLAEGIIEKHGSWYRLTPEGEKLKVSLQ